MKAFLCLALLLSPVAWAQDAKPPKHFRFIPLGDRPPQEEIIKDGVRIHLPFPPGTIPPKPTTLAITPKEGKEVTLRLKEFTRWASVKPATGGVKIFEGKVIGGKPLIASRFPKKGQSLGVLYPDHQKKNWFNPKMLIVSDDLISFPLGSVRFVNVSPHTALVRFGTAKADMIKPGEILIRKLKQGNNPVLVGYLDSTKNNAREVIFDNAIVLNAKQRIQAFFYQAQSKNPKEKVKFFEQGEFYVPPPKPKKGAKVAGG